MNYQINNQTNISICNLFELVHNNLINYFYHIDNDKFDDNVTLKHLKKIISDKKIKNISIESFIDLLGIINTHMKDSIDFISIDTDSSLKQSILFNQLLELNKDYDKQCQTLLQSSFNNFFTLIIMHELQKNIRQLIKQQSKETIEKNLLLTLINANKQTMLQLLYQYHNLIEHNYSTYPNPNLCSYYLSSNSYSELPLDMIINNYNISINFKTEEIQNITFEKIICNQLSPLEKFHLNEIMVIFINYRLYTQFITNSCKDVLIHLFDHFKLWNEIELYQLINFNNYLNNYNIQIKFNLDKFIYKIIYHQCKPLYIKDQISRLNTVLSGCIFSERLKNLLEKKLIKLTDKQKALEVLNQL